jgi:CheY-like chemotaxis protein
VRLHLDARPGEFVRLRVSDTGEGISPDILPRIFEPFFTTKVPGKGTGLGLAMVFGIVKQHQGWIDCTSKVNEGACFDIYLPCWRPATGSQTHAQDPANSPRHGHETILLADDEPMIRSLSRAILESYGYKVVLAEDGLQAVNIYEREKDRIDLVILDLTMPELSGRDALRRLAGIDPQVPVLFASGYSAENITGLQHGHILGFIAKPYQPEELARTVRLALDNLGKTSKITA